MPILRSALKQLRKDHKRHLRNQAIHSELKTLTKRFLGLLKAQKWDEAASLMRLVAKKYDSAASKGMLHRNTAARKKSRLTLQLNRVRSPKPTAS